MSVGFGFSVGDLIMAIGLIKVSIKAIQDGKGASAEYQLLEAELESLELGLTTVENLSIDTPAVNTAVEKAVQKCRQCIEAFVKKIAKYQPSLRAGNSTGSWSVKIRQIQWVLCRKEDIAIFRQQMAGHASSINMLLITLSVQTMKTNQNQIACRSIIEDIMTASLQSTTASLSHVEALSLLIPQILRNQESQNIQSNNDQSQEHLRTLAMLVPQLLQEIVSLHEKVQLRSEMPPQVLLQKPVIMLDACGKIAPFHLEFVTSAEAFLAVLKVRFKQAGVSPQGLKKINNSEFVLRDKQKDISLTESWGKVFKPGQRVDMSMLFHRIQPEGTCPGCQQENIIVQDSEVTCVFCGLEYRRIIEVNDYTFFGRGEQDVRTGFGDLKYSSSQYPCGEIDDFRRVQIVSPETGNLITTPIQTIFKDLEMTRLEESPTFRNDAEDRTGLPNGSLRRVSDTSVCPDTRSTDRDEKQLSWDFDITPVASNLALKPRDDSWDFDLQPATTPSSSSLDLLSAEIEFPSRVYQNIYSSAQHWRKCRLDIGQADLSRNVI